MDLLSVLLLVARSLSRPLRSRARRLPPPVSEVIESYSRDSADVDRPLVSGMRRASIRAGMRVVIECPRGVRCNSIKSLHAERGLLAGRASVGHCEKVLRWCACAGCALLASVRIPASPSLGRASCSFGSWRLVGPAGQTRWESGLVERFALWQRDP